MGGLQDRLASKKKVCWAIGGYIFSCSSQPFHSGPKAKESLCIKGCDKRIKVTATLSPALDSLLISFTKS